MWRGSKTTALVAIALLVTVTFLLMRRTSEPPAVGVEKMARPPLACPVPVCPPPKRAGGKSRLPPFGEAFKGLDWETMQAERERSGGFYSGGSLQRYLDILGNYLHTPELGPPRVPARPTPLTVDC